MIGLVGVTGLEVWRWRIGGFDTNRLITVTPKHQKIIPMKVEAKNKKESIVGSLSTTKNKQESRKSIKKWKQKSKKRARNLQNRPKNTKTGEKNGIS